MKIFGGIALIILGVIFISSGTSDPISLSWGAITFGLIATLVGIMLLAKAIFWKSNLPTTEESAAAQKKRRETFSTIIAIVFGVAMLVLILKFLQSASNTPTSSQSVSNLNSDTPTNQQPQRETPQQFFGTH